MWRVKIWICFNSTLVQLKDFSLISFHFSFFSFNSTLVQLKGKSKKSQKMGNKVSILP